MHVHRRSDPRPAGRQITWAPPQNPWPGSEIPMTVMQCSACFFPYDEAKGLPEEGIPSGTKWEDIPEDWVCPECGTPKHLFIEYAP